MAALTGAFSPVAVNSDMAGSDRFVLERQEALRQGTIYCCLVAATFGILYLSLDYVNFPGAVAGLAKVRVLYGIFVLLVYAALKTDPQLGRGLRVSVYLVIVTAAMISALIVITGGAASPYYVAYNLVIVIVAALLPWPVWLLLLSAATMMLMYLIAVAGIGVAGAERLALVNNLHFILVSAAAGAIALKFKNELVEAEFRSRKELVENATRQLRFFRLLSHELRAPVAAISGASELICETPESAHELSQGLHLNSERLLALLNGFLDFARLETGQLAMRTQLVDASRIIEEVGAALRPLAMAKHLALEVAPSVKLPTLTDPQLLRQLLINLVGNAIKFTAEGKVVIEVGTLGQPEMNQRLSEFCPMTRQRAAGPAAEWLRFQVTDSGIGIRPEDLGMLGIDFAQIDRPAEGNRGAGLGLAISRRMVEMLEGTLAVKSTVGAGTTFMAVIPWRPPRDLTEIRSGEAA